MLTDSALPIIPTIALFGCVLLAVYQFVVYPIFRHPLRHIPSAHWSVPFFGDCWILYQRWQRRNNAITYEAHQKHGEVVRMGSNELSVNCVDNGIKTIYAGGWEKHAWYPRQFASYGALNMFSIVEHTPHSQKKRTMAHVFSKSYIASSLQVEANSKALFSKRFLPLLLQMSDSAESVDVHELNNAFTMDFMSAFQFGLASGTNFTQDVKARQDFLRVFHSRRPYEFYVAETPWIKTLCNRLGLSLVPKSLDLANDMLEDWHVKICQAADSYLAQLAGATNPSPGDDPIVYKHFKQGLLKLRQKDPSDMKGAIDRSSDTKFSDLESIVNAEIYTEMLDQLGAGHETSAIALTYLYWELSQDRTLQKELRKEIQTLTPDIGWPAASEKDFELPTPKDIDALPLLNAILMETLRVHTSIPGMQPRVSPPTTSPTGNQLGRYKNIPGGVRVSSMPYTLHRNPEVFPGPHAFKPKRWLPSHTSEEQLKEMHRWFWAFGSGGRMCIGSHLAIQEIKLLVCAVYRNWWTEIVDDEGIEEIDAYTTRPTSNRLMLRFVHI